MKPNLNFSRAMLGLGLLILLSVLVAACGGNSDSSATGTSDGSAQSTGDQSGGESSSYDESKVNKILEEATGPAQWNGPTKPSPATPGKHIVIVDALSSTEGERIVDGGFEAAAKALGWTVSVIDGKGTPQGYAAGIEQALVENADGVMLNSIDPTLVLNQMRQVKAAGIPVVAFSNTVPPREGLWIANIGFNTAHESEILAAVFARESDGEAQVATFNAPEFGVVQQRFEHFVDSLGELCSGCAIVNETDFQGTEIETKLGPKVGATLQANPDVNWVWSGDDAFVPAMITGLKPAGLEVQIASYGGSPQNIELIENGEYQVATIAIAFAWQGWEAADTLNRAFNGEKPDPKGTNTDPLKLLTKENLPPPGQHFEGTEANYEQHYEELWGVSKE